MIISIIITITITTTLSSSSSSIIIDIIRVIAIISGIVLNCYPRPTKAWLNYTTCWETIAT